MQGDKPQDNLEKMTREELIAEIERLRPPCKVHFNAAENLIRITNVPMRSGKRKTFFVHLDKIGMEVDYFLKKEITTQRELDAKRPILVQTDELKKFKDNFAKKAFGRTLTDSQEQDICVACGAPCNPEKFKDALSAQEYRLSGLCQKCQDKTFDDTDDNGIDEEDLE